MVKQKTCRNFIRFIKKVKLIKIKNGNITIVSVKNVKGCIQHPNTITYVDGKGAKWYIDNAGGYSESAKKKKTFVIYPNGMMSRVSRGTDIEPGSEIVVPSKKKKHVDLANVAAIGAVLSPLATMIALISYLTK